MKPTSLAMLKMEKNFIAVLEKKYPRKPYVEYALIPLYNRLVEESKELKEAIYDLSVEAIRNEIADMSNILDFMFEILNRRAGAK